MVVHRKVSALQNAANFKFSDWFLYLELYRSNGAKNRKIKYAPKIEDTLFANGVSCFSVLE